MPPLYRTILTNAGEQAIAFAMQNNAAVSLSEMAVGDGAGNAITPDPQQSMLVREMFRAPVNHVSPSPSAENTFVAELTIPAGIGGFTLREAAIYTADGTLFAVANLPATYKPQDTEGSFADSVIRMVFVVANAQAVTVIADPNVVLASRTWVLTAVGPAQIIPGGLATQVLTKRSNADGDVEWRDPTDVNVSVDCIQEMQTAAEGQDTFILSTMSTTGVAVYVEGLRQFNAIALDNLTIKLPNGLAADTRILFVQNDPAAPYHNRLQRPGAYFFAQL